MMDPLNSIKLVKDLVAIEFYENKIKSACLAESMICKILLEKYCHIDTTLVKGYVQNKSANGEDLYWGHFWLTYNETIIDPSSQTWFLLLPREMKHLMKDRRLCTSQPKGTCLDAPCFHALREKSYQECLAGRFWTNMKKELGEQSHLIVSLFQSIENKLISNIHPG